MRTPRFKLSQTRLRYAEGIRFLQALGLPATAWNEQYVQRQDRVNDSAICKEMIPAGENGVRRTSCMKANDLIYQHCLQNCMVARRQPDVKVWVFVVAAGRGKMV
jgi:hypothetical protein